MDLFDTVIVGSGPAGVSAASRLQGCRLCLVDVAAEPPEPSFPYASLREALAAGDTRAVLGRDWEQLGNLVHSGQFHPKLRAAALRFVMEGEPFLVRGADGTTLLRAAGSYAAGGMSNAWGGQLFRYVAADFEEAGNWPLAAGALDPYYNDLERQIGISGALDDMAEFLGPVAALLPPVPAVPAAARLYARYQARRQAGSVGPLRMGRPRLALTTVAAPGRVIHALGETEFLTTGQPGFHTARNTLEQLRERGQIEYLPRHKLLSWTEHADHVELVVLALDSLARHTLKARHLLLACGTIQTARLVLLNRNALGHKLPFADHPPTLLPVFLPRMFGSSLPQRSFPVQLTATLVGRSSSTMISFYYPGGLLWSDLLPDIPLPIPGALKLLGGLLGGMLVAQIWETRGGQSNSLHLDADGNVIIDYPDFAPYSGLRELARALLPLGAVAIPALASVSPPGWGFHHAGCLPMRRSPGRFETHVDGRLWDSRRVRAIDGSVLPSLPAKNHSLTLMANAARIAEEVRRCGY